jgi:cyclic beta-1,2-glucan synthetase
VAHRTSPTNLGLYLLSAISARDFGWAGTTDTLERLEATLGTMGELARFRGHFYNWYDTRDLRPLDPQYVSSVDSGNLAGHLIALANACREWIGAPRPEARAVGGSQCLIRAARARFRQPRTQTIAHEQLDAASRRRRRARPGPCRGHAPRRDHGRHRPGARRRARRRGRRRDAVLGRVTRRSISHLRDLVPTLERRLAALEESAVIAGEMDFGFLLDRERRLLSIGYRVAEGQLDPSCYDLLASEARLASFVAIAKGDVASRHWFRLGRAVTPLGHGAALISWSGSMFEYLMPSLVMRAPAGSLLEQTSRLVVRRQIAYGAELDVPWGVSESAYNVRDLELTYQYSNFGIPGLGLKRGLGENAVIAPYATALAAMVDPGAAARNFARLTAAGALGRYGFYEALDYTPRACPRKGGRDGAFMAHHQGMTVVAIANALLDGRMRARFHAEPIVQATDLLLQERTPRDVAVAHPRAEEVKTAATVRELDLPAVRRIRSPHDTTPQAHLLSNGRYTVMLTAAGSGYSRWGDVAITRWREDATRDDWGSYVFLRDVRTGAVWSAGYQPCGVERALRRHVHEDRAELVRRTAFTTILDVMVSPADNARCAGWSRTGATGCARSTSLPTPSSRSHRRPPTRRTRLSPSSSCRPNISPRRASSSRRGGAARAASPRSGPRISPWSKARAWASPRARPIAPASSAADARCARRWRWWTACRSPTQPARCSIRFSRCAGACGSRRAARCASPSGRSSRPPAATCWISWTSIATRTPSSARRRWRGPRRRCSSPISA